jgi:hypothetical protein
LAWWAPTIAFWYFPDRLEIRASRAAARQNREPLKNVNAQALEPLLSAVLTLQPSAIGNTET